MTHDHFEDHGSRHPGTGNAEGGEGSARGAVSAEATPTALGPEGAGPDIADDDGGYGSNDVDLEADGQDAMSDVGARDPCATGDGDAGSSAQSEPGEPPSLEAVVPEEYADLLEDRPLLWYENADLYERLLGATFAEFQPRGVVECLQVKDFVDYVWESRRLKRLKVAAVHYGLPDVVDHMLPFPGVGILSMLSERKHHGDVERAAGGGNPQAKAELAKFAREQHLNPVDLHFRAHQGGLAVLEAISREAERLERRKDAILKQLDCRRVAMAAMARGLLARDEAGTFATVIEADPA